MKSYVALRQQPQIEKPCASNNLQRTLRGSSPIFNVIKYYKSKIPRMPPLSRDPEVYEEGRLWGMSPGYEDGREKEREEGREWHRWKGDAVGPTEGDQQDLQGRGSFSHIDHTTLPRYTELRRWKHLSPPTLPTVLAAATLRRSYRYFYPRCVRWASYGGRNILISAPLFLYIHTCTGCSKIRCPNWE